MTRKKDRRFLKGLLPFAKNMSKNTGKNIRENSSGTNVENLLDHANQSAADTHKTAPKFKKAEQFKKLPKLDW